MNEGVIESITDALWDWDPYGVSDLRSEIAGEYDSLLDDLLRHLRKDETLDGLKSWQARVVGELGLSPVPDDEADFIRKVKEAGGISPLSG